MPSLSFMFYMVALNHLNHMLQTVPGVYLLLFFISIEENLIYSGFPAAQGGVPQENKNRIFCFALSGNSWMNFSETP